MRQARVYKEKDSFLEYYKKMSAKEQHHQEFLNSLRERLNVDDMTIANLEKRITGKFGLDPLLAHLFTVKNSSCATVGSNWTLSSVGEPVLVFREKLGSCQAESVGCLLTSAKGSGDPDSLSKLIKFNSIWGPANYENY